MFNGMFFLPVILSLIGPAPHVQTVSDTQHNKTNGKVADESQKEKTVERGQEMAIVTEPGNI